SSLATTTTNQLCTMPTILSAMLFSRGPISRHPNGVQIENVAVIMPVLGSISESHASMRALEYKRLARFCMLLRFFIIGYCSCVASVVPPPCVCKYIWRPLIPVIFPACNSSLTSLPQPAPIHQALRFHHPVWPPPEPAWLRLAEWGQFAYALRQRWQSISLVTRRCRRIAKCRASRLTGRPEPSRLKVNILRRHLLPQTGSRK